MDKLPVELLAHTLSFVDPPSPYRLAKPASLYACCLVSKRVKEVAQPLLWTAVVVDKKGDFKVVRSEVKAGELGQHIRIFEADGKEIKASEISTLVQSLPRLAEVSLRNFGADHSNAVDELLPHLQDLRRIKLSEVDFLDIETPFPFNNLSSLSLSDVFTTRAFLSSLFQPRNLPVLRSLHLSDLSADGGETTFLPSISTILLSQLDVLQLSLDECYLATPEVTHNPTTLFSGALRYLHNCFSTGNLPELVKNLHIRAYGLDEERLRLNSTTLHFVRETLGKLAAFLPSSNIATLLLPLHLQQPALSTGCDMLLAACRAKGVEVLWENEPGAGKEGLFREEFRHWVVKKKRGEAEKGGAAA